MKLKSMMHFRSFAAMPAVAVVLLLTGLMVTVAAATDSANDSKESASSEEASPEEDLITFPVEMGSFQVRVQDADAEPIAGATVLLNGVRCAEDPGSWYGWPTYNAGTKNELLTDEQGEVTFQYPKFFGKPPKYETTNKLCFSFSHPGFIAAREEAPPDSKLLVATMKPGCEIEFSAMDHRGQPLEEFGVMVAASDGTPSWIRDRNTVRSSSVPDGKRQTMLVAPQSDGPTLFSGVLPASYKTGQPFTIRNVILSPGLFVHGVLADNVPRPIEDGIVIAWCQPKPNEEDFKERQAIGWTDSSPIAADGSFEFESLPRSGTIQFIAVCRGWVIQNVPREWTKNKDWFISGVLVDLKSAQVHDNRLIDIELPMEATGSLEVTVKKPDGTPLVGATVSTWPNQMLEHGGSQLLGNAFPTLDMIRVQISGESQRWMPWRDKIQSRYVQKTDADGKVIIHDIPTKDRKLGLHVEDDEYQIPKDADHPDGAVEFKMDSPDRKQIDIVVEAIDRSK